MFKIDKPEKLQNWAIAQRASKGLSVSTFAQRCNISVESVYGLESGRRLYISDKMIAGLCKVGGREYSSFCSEFIELPLPKQKEEIIGFNIKRARIRRAFTQTQLAARSRLSISFLSLVERGMRGINDLHILQLSEAMDIKPSDIDEDFRLRFAEPSPKVQVKKLRLAARLSVTDLAGAIGCSKAFISRVESGDLRVSNSYIHRVQNAVKGTGFRPRLSQFDDH